MDYKKTAEEILEHVGGSENVNSVVHCMTRLRFTLSDPSKVNTNALQKVKGVIGTTNNGGQFQVIIGNNVPTVFAEVQKLTGGNRPSAPATEEKKMNWFLRIINVLASVMTPIIPALAGSGILKVILAILVMTNVLKPEDQTYYIINFIADSVFYFLPVLLAVSSAHKFNTNVYLAVTLGGVLLHPNFAALVAAKDPVNFIGLPITLVGYSSTVIPIIIVVWLMSYVERFAERVSPSMIKIFLKPLIIIGVMAPLALIVIGPLGFHAGNLLAGGIYFLQEKAGWLSLALLTGFKPLIVMTGMHWAFVPAIVTSLSTYGYEGLMLVSSLGAIFSLTGACLGVAIKTKSSSMRQIALSAGTTSLLAGITEPAVYGVALKLRRVLVFTIISGLIAGAFSGLTKVKLFALVTPSLLKFPTFISDQYTDNLMNAAITAVIAFGISFTLTVVFGFKEEVAADETSDADITPQPVSSGKQPVEVITSPLTGASMKLAQVEDNVFSKEIMGRGIAILPEKGEVTAPADGTITALMDSRHAVGFTTDKGVEILIHVGIDTVNLAGKHFTSHVKMGDHVKAGDLLLTFDLEKIKQEGYEVVTPVIITNTADYMEVLSMENTNVNQGEKLLSIL
ncbi:PTS beta-glucoside transporter subunit EIIBCA [Rossellomorea marisflavi]|uniref:beta-glucoside-specific PTS transporter subunit IIABC n=1 Tax=Rossellomorea marisflavi TaxID=189381 RepID=UPI0025C922B5|nr:beta-glucoside-specific PTS transporter subunit IIABC [Rossellomorea marisflavi]UTE73102.1 beta-glucoside-specific PTS transporter subunit IIABC [Rossellomorea marisflavi]GLI84264.1 PTS beta-glucoside transporter subunit EIIBCA [Rossellomorea marisflavi]